MCGWCRRMPAKVPGTVLSNLVRNGVYPDPFVGLNNKCIPDIADVGPSHYTFWFCCEFAISDCQVVCTSDDRWWLQLDGVNYSLSAFLNGTRIPIEQDRGMYLHRSLDVTASLKKGTNHLALLVRPPDHYGIANGMSKHPTPSYRPSYVQTPNALLQALVLALLLSLAHSTPLCRRDICVCLCALMHESAQLL